MDFCKNSHLNGNIIKFTPIVLMGLRWATLLISGFRSDVKKTAVFLLLILFCPQFSHSQNGTEDVKKQAENLFEEESFTEAYKFYSQLVANFPKDPEYNYRLGVCMIYSEPDKKKCIPYLKQAAANTQDPPKDVFFYLGKAYHINYQFDEAIKYYNEFKKTASSSRQKKLQVDREIKSCQNGKQLLSNLSDLVVQSKKQLNETDYFRSYDLKSIGGKLLVKPEDFRMPADKKKKEKSVMFLPKGSNAVYFSSYGEKGETGKDIYTAAKLPNGSYSKPQKVNGINTEFDEDFPFLHPDGKTLYFASKGHNSMGGYDIFKSVYNEETNSWGTPVNLEFPINSPDDDYLFVTDSLEKTAYFSTGRQSPPGKIDVLKIITERKPIDVLVIKGNVAKETAEQGLNAVVNVKNVDSDAAVGTFSALENGEYSMELPNGAKLMFTVETPGQKTQSAEVNLPMATNSRPYKQTIAYEEGVLKIINQFDEGVTDDTYLQYLKVIEKKAKLEVNESNYNQPVAQTAKTDTSGKAVAVVKDKKNTRPQLLEEGGPAAVGSNNPTPNQSVDNKQLSQIAAQDADEAQQEAKQLERDAKDAAETGQKQKEEATKRLAEAEESYKAAEAITNEEEKTAAIAKATEQKLSAETDLAMAEKILDFSKSLQSDADNKQKEADLNREYAAELQKTVNNKNNAASLAKLEKLQQLINTLSNEKAQSDKVLSGTKTSIEQKETQITDLERSNNEIKTSIDELNTEISTKEAELAKTRKQNAKDNLVNQINTIKAEKSEKEKEIVSNETQVKKLNIELSALKNEVEIANRIKSEDLVITNTPVASTLAPEPIKPTSNTTANPVAQKISAETLADKYKDKVVVNDPSNKTELEQSNTQLKSFNAEIDKLVAKNKAGITKAKTQATKNSLSAENTKLETLKKQNSQLIASNSKQLQTLKANENSAIAATPQASVSPYAPIIASTPKEAVTKLETLDKQLVFNDNDNFDFNGYESPEAQKLKVEADARINDAIVRQKKLKEEIQESKKVLASAPVVNGNPDELNKESEELHSKAVALLSEAKTKEGAEKEKLIADAKVLEDQSNDKHLQVALINEQNNSGSFDLNKENFETLSKQGKAPEADLNEAKKLNDEAELAFKQAKEIRSEIANITSLGAKLGNYSNAEEKEAEAILKQQQAIDLLKKSNPDLALKTPVKPEAGAAAPDLSTKMEEVNASVKELAEIKIDSYKKLNQANGSEIDAQINNIGDKQAAIDNNPRLKTELLNANKKLDNAKQLREKSEASNDNADKLNLLIASVKEQNAALKQLKQLNESLPAVATTTPAVQNPTPTTENPPAATTTTTEPEPAVTTNTSAPASPSETPDTTPVVAAVEVPTVNDTSTTQLVAFFETNSPGLKNQQAGTQVKKSIDQLAAYEKELAVLEQKAASGGGDPNAPAKSAVELKTLSDTLTSEAENLSMQAFKAKKESETKEGAEKAALIAKSKELDSKALDKNIEAADLLLQSNEIDVQSNQNAITDMIEQLKTDNPELADQMAEKNRELKTLRTQIQRLRTEAENNPNRAAKLGAYSNAEEREIELIEKQNLVLLELSSVFPNYEIKQLSSKDLPAPGALSPEAIAQKKKSIQQNQYSELTSLTNAFSLEYESSKNNVPAKLSADQTKTKANAEGLNAESKRLLIQSTYEKNEAEKMKMLTRAARYGSQAVQELATLVPAGAPTNNPPKTNPNAPATNTAVAATPKPVVNKPAAPAVTPPKPAPVVPVAPVANTGGNTVRVDGLEVIKGNAYSDAKPIPINAKIEDGLVFRVQIGAFKIQLPNNAFRGLSPLNGETTANGYFRYTAGNFNKYEMANAVKNDLRGLGYSDAFIVAYYNGKRLSLAEAMELLSKEGKTIDASAPQSAGITANVNVPRAAANPVIQTPVQVSRELEKINGLLFTIQIGVFNKQVTKQQLFNLRPINTELLPSGLYRYTAGIYNSIDKLMVDKNRVINLGVRDAFVSAYLNGKKITFAEAKDKQANDQSIKMEAEDPIVFGGNDTPAQTPANPAPAGNNNTAAPVQPFSNGVNNYPAATAENGIKTNEEGVCFKVQIGAYTKQVPADVAAKFSSIKTWPVENKQSNSLFIYNIGNFSELRFAKQLKEEALKLGISDAFITVYRDGKKLYGTEAAELMNR